MESLSVLTPALIGLALALLARKRLRTMAVTTWLGWTVIGAGLPVLAGQLAALALAGPAEARLSACRAAGEPCPEAGLAVAFVLSAGLAAGLGWAAGAIAARLFKA